MNSEMIIRTASEADAPPLLEIYAPYVERTAITFEYEVPSVDEFASRIRNTLQKYPYLVAEKAAGSWDTPMPVLSMTVLPMTGQ